MKSTKRGLRTWAEWEDDVRSGAARESSVVFPRYSGVECPRTYIVGENVRTCKANLKDTRMTIECDGDVRRVVVCNVCEFVGCKLIIPK